MPSGCERNHTAGGRLMAPPYAHVPYSTHAEHILQTLVTHWLYKRTHPTAEMAPPLLLRCDREGAHGYTVPKWAVDGLPALLGKLRQ